MTAQSISKGTALLTGSARGIGRAIALRLALDGYDIALNDLPSSEKALSVLREEILTEIKPKRDGIRVHIFPADVSEGEEVENMVKEVVDVFGGLDIMVSNAAIMYQRNLVDIDTDQWDRLFSVNVRGMFLCYKYAGKQMIKQGRGGRIIGASSMGGKQGQPGLSSYCASKFAIRGLTQSAALEFGQYGITVNAYAPGIIKTELLKTIADEAQEEVFKNMSPLKRIGTAEEVAGLVSYLISPEAAFITGQSISINGGLYFE